MPTEPTGRPRLLVAEDNRRFAAVLKGWLSIDYDILEVVSSGERLVEQTATLRPDAVVSDVGLKGMNGIEATTRIRKLFPTLPIVLVTAGCASELRPHAVAAGAVTVLDKSRPTELADVLRRLWSGRRPKPNPRASVE